MKVKKLGIVVVVSLSMLLTACGKSDAVKNVEAEIRSLETITIDSGADIEKAEADYTALTDEEKKQVENIEALEAAKEEFREIRQIADLEEKVTGALDGCTWYFNGGADTILNSIVFASDLATISQVVFDGNGKHDSGSYQYKYTVDTENILIVLADGSNFTIPYRMDENTVSIGQGEYYTIEEIDAAIQGCWSCHSSNDLLGPVLESVDSILFQNGRVTSENAAEAYRGTDGEYYFSSYQGTYKLNFGGLDTDIHNGNYWFYNIIDGEVAVLHFDHVCSPSDGLPGEYGYSFD